MQPNPNSIDRLPMAHDQQVEAEKGRVQRVGEFFMKSISAMRESPIPIVMGFSRRIR
jgi:hypothetical protein